MLTSNKITNFDHIGYDVVIPCLPSSHHVKAMFCLIFHDHLEAQILVHWWKELDLNVQWSFRDWGNVHHLSHSLKFLLHLLADIILIYSQTVGLWRKWTLYFFLHIFWIYLNYYRIVGDYSVFIIAQISTSFTNCECWRILQLFLSFIKPIYIHSALYEFIYTLTNLPD